MKTSRNVVWSDPRAEQCGGEIESLDRDEHVKIANDLGARIASIVTNSYANRDIIKNLIANAITEQIRQYLREYDNIVAEDILNSLKSWKLGEIKGWMSEIDFEYARHGKLSTFGDELKKEFERLKTQNQLERVKSKVMALSPIPGSGNDKGGQVWLSNVLTIIDEEMHGSKPKETPPETSTNGDGLIFNDDLDLEEKSDIGDPRYNG